MNIRGIELLIELGLPVPRKSIVFRYPAELGLDYLYDNANKGVTILCFDYSEPINHPPHLEKDVRKYKVDREDFVRVCEELVDELSGKGVIKSQMVFLTHQTYMLEDISYSGFIYRCPVVNGRMSASEGGFAKKEIEFPIKLVERIFTDLYPIFYKSPFVDFEVYQDTGELFYHDLTLSSPISQYSFHHMLA